MVRRELKALNLAVDLSSAETTRLQIQEPELSQTSGGRSESIGARLSGPSSWPGCLLGTFPCHVFQAFPTLTPPYKSPCTLLHISKQRLVLTDTGDEVVKPFLREQWVLQTPEVELQYSSHRVDVMVALLINQRVITWTRDRMSQPHPQSIGGPRFRDLQATLKLTPHLSQRSS